MSQPTRVLSLQPYFGGSHAQFHSGWLNKSEHEWTTLTLPPRHWKWRMRHASIHFTKLIHELAADGNAWDVIFCSDMLNVAEFKGLIAADSMLRDTVARLPIVIYFHENQFAYPTRKGFQPDQQFPFINFISALTGEKIWFNSRFNFDSMLAGLKRHAGRWPDFVPNAAIDSLASKVDIQPPGIETPPIDVADFQRQRAERAANKEPVRIVWAARWEHDKNAEDLLAALKILSEQGVPFQLSVLGQSFRRRPPVFDELKSTFDSQILRWGFQETRQQYWESLAESDVFVSTAKHEFFGLSAAESIAAGVTPLFPNRLAYPELLQYANADGGCLYDGTAVGLARALQDFHQSRLDRQWTNDLKPAHRIVEQLNWNRRATELDQALTKAVGYRQNG